MNPVLLAGLLFSAVVSGTVGCGNKVEADPPPPAATSIPTGAVSSEVATVVLRAPPPPPRPIPTIASVPLVSPSAAVSAVTSAAASSAP